jgi:hypothetical protein
MNNTNSKALMELMGHKDLKMAARYSHLSDDYERQAVAKLPRFTGDEAERTVAESREFLGRTAEPIVVGFDK